MRRASACSICRSRKKKCVPSSTSPDTSCTLCIAKRLRCDLADLRTPEESNEALEPRIESVQRSQCPTASAGENGSYALRPGSLPVAVGDELIDLYFDMVHNKQQIAFHRQTFIAERRAGTLPQYLLFGVAALMSRFSSNSWFEGTDPHDRAAIFLQHAMSGYHARKQQVSIHALQACILLGFVNFTEGYGDAESLLSAQAVRIAQLLRFPDLSCPDPLYREMQIRLYWQLSMMDSWDSARDGLSQQLPSTESIPAPLDDDVFECLVTGQAALATLLDDRRSGVWAAVSRLSQTHAEIMRLIENLATRDYAFSAADVQVQAIAAQLDAWVDNLPPGLYESAMNFERFAAQRRGREFAVMHLLYHYQGQLLYYPYLGKDLADPLDDHGDLGLAQIFAVRCKRHAASLSQLMWNTNSRPGMECLWSPVNGHLLVVASTVLLHTLLFDGDSEHTADSKRLLEQNYTMMLQFREYWPTLKLSIKRLDAFHQSCQRDLHVSCYRLDAWMMNFLVRFDTPVDSEESQLQREKITTSNSAPNVSTLRH